MEIQLLEERMKQCVEKIEKIDRYVFGRNGDPGLKGEHEVVKNNLRWIKWLLGIQLPMVLGILIAVVTKFLI